MILSPSRFLATEQCEGQEESRRFMIGIINGVWMSLVIWAILAAVVMGYS